MNRRTKKAERRGRRDRSDWLTRQWYRRYRLRVQGVQVAPVMTARHRVPGGR